jgi:serine/threonine-protein kinase
VIPELPDRTGAEIEPAKVMYRGPDAAILNAPTVETYVQLPGRRFPK